MRYVRVGLGLAVLGVVIGLPWAYGVYRHHTFRNFRVVKPGVLYRSGQMSLPGLKRVIHDYGIKTIITLRDARVDGRRPPDIAEEEYCQKADIRYVRISPKSWWPQADDDDNSADGIKKFLKVMDNPNNYPVLVHCFAGVHRTGTMCAVYRMEHDGWSNERAIDEMKRLGYFELDETRDLLRFLMNYDADCDE